MCGCVLCMCCELWVVSMCCGCVCIVGVYCEWMLLVVCFVGVCVLWVCIGRCHGLWVLWVMGMCCGGGCCALYTHTCMSVCVGKE